MAVSYSNSEAAKAMTLHLGRLGYKKIAFACLDSRNNDRSRHRRAGYLAALRQLGQTPDPRLIIDTARRTSAGAETVAHAVAAVPDVEATLCGGGLLAPGDLTRVEEGKRVADR